MRINSYKDLKVYQKAYTESVKLHKETFKLPQQEQYELGSQLRRASKTIALNIAEGFSRNASLKDFKRFLVMALGSCEEVQVILDYLYDLGYMDENIYKQYVEAYKQIGKMLVKMKQEWK